MEIMSGYKQTEVGVIPEDWALVKIINIAEIRGRVGWKGYTKGDLRFSGPYVIGAKHINKYNKLDLTESTHLSIEKFKESPEIIVELNDVLIVQRGTIGKLVFIDSDIGEATINPSMVILRINSESFSPLFIFYILLSPIGQKQILLDTSSTGVPMISQKQIGSFLIPLPSISEQKAIAEAFSNLDSLIFSLEQLIDKKRNIKQGAMQELLSGKRRLPAFDFADGKYKKTEIGMIPEEWEIRRVGEICDFIVPGRNKPRIFDGDIPWITTPDFNDGESVFESRVGLSITREEAKKVGSKIVPAGAVIMSCVGELGVVASVTRGIVINQQLHAFIPSPTIDKSFLLYSLQTKKQYLQSIATLTTVPYLNKDKCNSIPIPLPTLPEQQAIAAVLSDMDTEITALQEQRDKYISIKQGMMQELLTGRTRLI